MPAAYLTPEQAQTRLAAHGFDLLPLAAVVSIASDDLDLKTPFIGKKLDPATQHRQFPRDTTVQDDVAGTVPSRVLDWVALRAYQLTKQDDAPIIIEQVNKLSVRYEKGKRSNVARLMDNKLRPYKPHQGHGVIV